MRTIATAAAALAAAALAAAAITLAALAAITANPSLPPCATEDSTGCYWDADTMGNGRGNDLVTLH